MTTRFAMIMAAAGLTGCVPILQQNQAAALATAQRRAQFELDCPQVTPSILSQKTIDGVRWDLHLRPLSSILISWHVDPIAGMGLDHGILDDSPSWSIRNRNPA